MIPRKTLILAGIGVLVLAAGLVLGTGRPDQKNAVPAGSLAFPNLAGQLQDAARVEIAQAGSKVTLARRDATWVVPDHANYPAQQDKVHALTTALTELKLSEPRTADPDQYARLGVEDAAGKDSKSTLVQVLDNAGVPIAGLLVGHAHTGSHGTGDGVYVRRPGEAQSWLAEGQLAPSTDAHEWLDRQIANITRTDVTSVTTTRDRTTLSFVRKDGTLTLTAPAEHPRLDPFKVEDVSHGLEVLTFTDVRPAPAPGNFVGQAVFTTGNGLSVTIRANTVGAADPDQQVWIEITASGDGAAKPAAEALQAKVKGWAYRVQEWRLGSFAPTLDDLKAYQPPPGTSQKPDAPP